MALIGCGQIARVHAQRILEDGRAKVTALFDRDPEMAQRLKGSVAPPARVFSSLEELLEAGLAEAAIVATPTRAHADQVKACLQARLPTLCEKPLAEDRESILELMQLSERSGLICSLGYQRRYWSGYRTVKRELESGRWGKLLAITSHNTEAWQQTIAGTWRDDPEQNWGGFLGDAGSHKVDQLFHLAPFPVKEVFAKTWNCGSRVEIVASITAVLEGEQEIPVNMDFVGNASYLHEDFHCHCEQGDVMIRNRTEVWVAHKGRLERITELEPDSDPTRGFLDLLDGTAMVNRSPFSAALPVYDFTSMVLESARRKQIITRVH